MPEGSIHRIDLKIINKPGEDVKPKCNAIFDEALAMENCGLNHARRPDASASLSNLRFVLSLIFSLDGIKTNILY